MTIINEIDIKNKRFEIETVSDEPYFHSMITDCLLNNRGEERPDSYSVKYCDSCEATLHASNDECIQAWFETEIGNFCLKCFFKIFDGAI